MKRLPRILEAIKRKGPLAVAKRAGAHLAYSWNLPRGAHDIVTKLPLFAPHSAGSWNARAKLTVLAANQTFPFIVRLISELGDRQPLDMIPVDRLCADTASKEAAARLKDLFDKYGSDKSTGHNYECLYGPILKNTEAITAVLEIGLGTDNVDVVSNMGQAGRPGASLRAFRDFLPRALIYGADVDSGILFEESRIQTFFVDQTDLASFETLGQNLQAEFDLIIDDGLHSPNANVAVLIFALGKLKRGGSFVVEDIAQSALPVWQVVAALLPMEYRSRLIEARGGNMFAVERLA